METRYIYFRPDKTNRSGAVCVGYYYDPMSEGIRYAITICSKDDKFSRKDARAILEERLKITNSVIDYTPEGSEPKYIEAVEMIKEDLFKRAEAQNFPGRRRWMKKVLSTPRPEPRKTSCGANCSCTCN